MISVLPTELIKPLIIVAQLLAVDESLSPEFDTPIKQAFSNSTEQLIYTPHTKEPLVPGIYR